MSATLKIRDLLWCSRFLSTRTVCNVWRTSVAHDCERAPLVYRNGMRRLFTAQAAPVYDENLSVRGSAVGTRNRSSALPSARQSPLDRRSQRSDGRATDFEKSLARMDMDVKRLGRVSLLDLTTRLQELRDSNSITSQTALLMIRCCGNLLLELKPEDRIKFTNELWNLFTSKNSHLDISHYNALLKVHLENGYQFDPTLILATLEQKGIPPNRVTYQRLAAFYCQKGDIEGATKILEFMRVKDIPVNETVFNVLIQGYARANDMENAEGVLEMMRSSKLEPSSASYRTLLEAFAERGDTASMQRIMVDAEKREVQLSDADYLDVLLALVSKGHKASADLLLSKLRKNPGYFHDAMNSLLRLLDSGADDIAYGILCSLPAPKDPSDRIGFGTLFMRKLIRYDYPASVVWNYAMDMRDKGLNPWALERLCEAAHQIGRGDYAKDFLQKMAEKGVAPLRPHYFWPILSVCRKNGDVKGVWETIKLMNDLNVTVSLDTLTEYALPALKGIKSDEIIAEAKANFPALSVVSPLVVFHLESGDMKEALRLLQQNNLQINPTIMIKPLASAFVANNDYGTALELLKFLNGNSTGRQGQPHDSAGDFLLSVIQMTRGDEKILEELMKQMVSRGLKVSAGVTNTIDDRLRGRMTNQIGSLLNRLNSGQQGINVNDESEFGKHPRHMNIAELEDHLKELQSKNMNTRGVLRRLLIENARIRDVKRAEEIKGELDANGFEYSGSMYSQLMDMYTATGDLDKAIGTLKSSEAIDSSFIVDSYKILNLMALMISNDRSQDAVKLLNDYMERRGRPLDFEALERNVFRVLNAAAEKGDIELLKNLWDQFQTMGKFIATNTVCGPLVKVHLLKNDLPAALKTFEDCVTNYKQTPWKSDVLRRLIEAEDTKNLQMIMDMSIKIHGETNALFDLAFAFVDAGKYKQAQKVFDTPGLRARHDRLESFAERLIEAGRVKEMEGMILATRDIFDVDRDVMYHFLVKMYGKVGDPDKALAVWTNMQEENVLPSGRTLRTLAQILQQHNREVPFHVPEEVKGSDEVESAEEQQLLNLIREDNVEEAVEQKRILDDKNEKLSVKGYSFLIEALLQKERVKEAVSLTHELLQSGQHPYPAVSRFLVSKLSRNGEASLLEELAPAFSDKMANFLQLQKHVFSAYVNSNRPEEVLERYEQANPQERRIPITGVLSLLRKFPNLTGRVEKLVRRNAENGDMRPAVALWSYLFGERKFDHAKNLLEEYPSISLHLRAMPICERAHENNDTELLRKLIETLREHSRPNVALAYSYLIGLNCHNRDYRAGLSVLKEAQDEAGLALHELRLTALRILEKGLVQMGQPVPFRIPDNARYQQQQQQSESQYDENDDTLRKGKRSLEQ